MSFLLLLLVNATLFIRPGDFLPALQAVPIFNILMMANLAVGLIPISGKLAPTSLRADPITACILGLLGTIMLSQLARVQLNLACEGSLDFVKVVLFYLALLATIRSPARLRWFLAFLVGNIVALTVLALLQYHGWVDLPALAPVGDGEVDAETGQAFIVMRLCSAGIFNDPNDLSLILIVGIGSSLFLVGADRGQVPRLHWLVPAVLFLYALTLTFSRGGFLALVAGMIVLFYGRFGLRKAAVLAVVALPLMAVLFAGRQSNISTSDDTGQDRIQLWAHGLAALRGSPVFGIGYGRYAEEVGLVAHNSFVHAYVELGVGGGCLFFAMFAYAGRTLLALSGPGIALDEPTLRRARPFLLAITAGYACGMLTVSRNYVIPTYLVLGLDAAYFALVAGRCPGLVGPAGPIRPLSRRLAAEGLVAGLGFLLVINVFVNRMVRW